nr:hypothetical protein Itr_chr09CG08680 [Ipomoea trifida]GMD75880.1 hypothetical protein Iba_chr13bCG4970 [Ipomoea batatas]
MDQISFYTPFGRAFFKIGQPEADCPIIRLTAHMGAVNLSLTAHMDCQPHHMGWQPPADSPHGLSAPPHGLSPLTAHSR